MGAWPFERRDAHSEAPRAVVEEGELLVVPTHDASAMDRRAFGEFTSPRGELASYAFGWVDDPDVPEARMTIGIGAGNPGGATFHAVVFPKDDGHAYSLVDEPFADVPQGGPDLSADEARAHDDLPFVWAVADAVMERDRRAWWMRHWLVRTMCLQTPEVFDRQEPVLLVSHDPDGDWQLIGATDAGSRGHYGHLHHTVDEDPTLIEVLDLGRGEQAVRARVGGPWTRSAEHGGATP